MVLCYNRKNDRLRSLGSDALHPDETTPDHAGEANLHSINTLHKLHSTLTLRSRMHTHKFHIHHLSKRGFKHTLLWSVSVCVFVVIATAMLGRATHNFKAALTDKPDVAIYLLLPEEEIGHTTLLKETDTEREYLAETKDGPKLIKLKKGPTQWFVSYKERLHE